MTEREQGGYGLDELIEVHKRHLAELERQAATLGIATPPHITSEISRYKAELYDLTKSAGMSLSDDTVAKMGDTARYQLLYGHIMRIDGDIWSLKDDIKKYAEKLDKIVLALLGNVTMQRPKDTDV